jgi:hypothetical protein
MKKLTIILLTVFCMGTATTKGQITLDTIKHTIVGGLGYDFKTVQISNTETKYFQADTITNTFNLYNMDWTPFITNVAVPIPFSYSSYFYQCLYITRTLFDCDSTNIEYLYTSPLGAADRQIFVMRTDGTQLFQIDSAFCEYCFGDCLGGESWVKPIVNSSSGARLFVLRTFQPWTGDIYIYDLCGEVPTSMEEFTSVNNSFVKVFPNPTSGSMTFEINPPDNAKEYELIILDNESRVLKRKQIGIGEYKFTIDLKDFSSGNYIYSLCTKDKSYQSGKFIITK